MPLRSSRPDTRRVESPDRSGSRNRVQTYLTNGVFLYRVVGSAASDVGEVVELEDCYLLDVARVPIDDFHVRGLRIVTPAVVND